MLPHHHHHHQNSSSVTDTIDFFSEQSPFFAESIQYAKQTHKNKTHIPPEERNLVFPQQQPLSPVREYKNSWFDDDNDPFSDTIHQKNIPSPIQNNCIQDDQVFLEGGNCDFEDLFESSSPQQPMTKKVKYDHQDSHAMMNITSVKPASSSPPQDNLLSILLREQQKQGAEITELKQMVHNLQAQIMMHPMYQQQFILYQQHQQQQYQLYLQQQNNNQQQHDESQQ